MKKTLLCILFSIFLIACSGVKNTQQAISAGNYNKAIAVSVENLKKNKFKKGNQPHIILLEEAYAKAVKRDLSKIDFLKKDNNPQNLERIYNLYQNLDARQELIKPLLPLNILKKERTARFSFNNYDDKIIKAKDKLTTYLYDNAKKLLKSSNKFDSRTAYDDLAYIEKINPNFKDVRSLQEIAHEKGTDYVLVSIKNLTQQVIPRRLEIDLLNFDTYGLNDLWTVYHARKNTNIYYDFGLELNFRTIFVSPEQVREKQIIQEKLVQDGFKYQLDDKGNYVLDEKGEKIKINNLVKVRCQLYQFTQFKTARVVGQVRYLDLQNRQQIHTYPIKSEFIFNHRYANYKGDKRALERNHLDLIRLRTVRFPTNEQMIYDAGQDLKQRLKNIIVSNRFRN